MKIHLLAPPIRSINNNNMQMHPPTEKEAVKLVVHHRKLYRKRKKQNRTNTTNMPTLADVVSDSNLMVALFDSPANGIILPLDKMKYKKLYKSIKNALFSHLQKSSFIPTFNENKHVRGRFTLSGTMAKHATQIGRF